MNLSIQTLIVLQKPGHPPMYFTPAEAEQMGGGFAQLSAVIKDQQKAAEAPQKEDDGDQDEPDVAGEKGKPNGKAEKGAPEADRAN